MVDDHQFFIDGVQARLIRCDEVESVVHAPTVATLFRDAPSLDLVVLDLRLRDGSSPTANVEAVRRHGVPVLVLTSGEDPHAVREAARAGVVGVICKSLESEDIVAAIVSAARGELVATTDWAAAIDGDPDIDLVDLSPQSRRVLELYASGETASRVASQMKISVDTVNDYLDRIRTKYAAAGRPTRTKSDLYKRALEDGWLPFPRRRRT
ncbi:response regulator transcription factor [Rhodococcus corynebacterioides]|uniref:Response regulator transcription factor n=2 Tax=Rhodococcoides corynebacterioides TaxID=53972 RepID=A0ABS7P4K8_9NOCA|nr:response regulator transcription factor [Rhodococcus corynebacterioides]MBY6408052.1 response regulator transcription factor [Rhodococcus corynebacterioides]